MHFSDYLDTFFSEFEMKKVDDRPKIMKYVMQLEADMTIQQDYTIDASGEITLSESSQLWRKGPIEIFEIDLVELRQYPPIKLIVNYTSQAKIELTTTVKSETHHSGDFRANGKVLISKYAVDHVCNDQNANTYYKHNNREKT